MLNNTIKYFVLYQNKDRIDKNDLKLLGVGKVLISFLDYSTNLSFYTTININQVLFPHMGINHYYRRKKELSSFLRNHGIKLLKSLGQNFLINPVFVKTIVKKASLKKQDIVLEIGPGVGIITQELAKIVREVIAVEKDSRIITVLKENLRDFKNIKIINKDILKIDTFSLIPKSKKYKIVANLPYYISLPVIRKFLEDKNPPKEMFLMIQKQVAQRICARVPKMNLLAVSVQFYGSPKILNYVSKENFFPQPKVDSAIIKIIPQKKYKKINSQSFFKIVKASFSQPRKQLVNNLAKGLKLNKEKIKFWLLKNNIKPRQRAETLTISDWIKLVKTFNSRF